MRYAGTLRAAVLLVTLGSCFSWGPALHAQDASPAEEPNLFQQAVTALSTGEPGDSTWSGMDRRPDLPQAENDGSIRGATLSERMSTIRRRATETDISKPFQAQDQGLLPVVERRPLAGAPVSPPPVQADPRIERLPELPAAAPVGKPSAPPPVHIPTSQIPPRTPSGNRIATQPYQRTATPAERVAPSAEPTPPPVHTPPRPQTAATPVAPGVLLRNAAPSLSFETSGPRSIILGQEASYQVTMVNRGDADAANVVCQVRLPEWADVVSQSATNGAPNLERSAHEDQQVRWEISSLAAGARETLTLRIVPRDSRPFDLAVGWTFQPDRAAAQIEVKEPKIELQLSGSEEIDYGATDVYTITISNPGTGTAENVVLNLMPMSSNQQVAGSKALGSIAPGGT